MSVRSFHVFGEQLLFVANATGCDRRYRAETLLLPSLAELPARADPVAETVIFVAAGTVELMINGASGRVSAGEFVCIPPGFTYACRNPTYEVTRLLVRATEPPRRGSPRRITIDIAAA